MMQTTEQLNDRFKTNNIFDYLIAVYIRSVSQFEKIYFDILTQEQQIQFYDHLLSVENISKDTMYSIIRTMLWR